MHKQVVIFTGAGASHYFGLPVTARLTELITQGIKNGTLFSGLNKGRTMRKRLREHFEKELPSFHAEDTKFVSITEIVTLLDYAYKRAMLDGNLKRIGEVLEIRKLVEFAILDTIKRAHFKVKGGEARVTMARRLLDVAEARGVAMISTNYDELLEYHVYRQMVERERLNFDSQGVKIINRKINFGLSWRDGDVRGKIWFPPVASKFSVLKLHGSTLWFKCNGCGWVVCVDAIISEHQNCLEILCNQAGSLKCDCGSTQLGPLIVGPSLVRDTRDGGILSVWRTAEEQLRNAKVWAVVGYSLPPEDVEILGMMLRAIRGREAPPRIVVYQAPKQNRTRGRYKAYFPYCEYRDTGMAGFMRDLNGGDFDV
jgi:NAD-dependent SIR2 family protein deacetylase